MKTSIRLSLIAVVLTLAMFSCTDADRTDLSVEPIESEIDGKPITPGNSNPVIAYNRYYQVNNNRSVPAIYVMDADGGNKTKVYTNYTNQTFQTPDYPAWSSEGTRLCFTLNGKDLYTLAITLVNGYPVGSNPIKIGDGVAGGGSYRKGAWKPGADQISCVWQRNGDPYKIHILPAAGGTPSIIYTSASNDWVIEDYLSFKSDASALVFAERQLSTGNNFLKVFDISTNTIIKTINLSQFKSVTGIDWGKTPGSNTIVFSIIPLCSQDPNGVHKLYTIDINTPEPTLVMLSNIEMDGVSWSPDDSKIAVMRGGVTSVCGNGCCIRRLDGISTFSFSTQNSVFIESSPAKNPDWKR